MSCQLGTDHHREPDARGLGEGGLGHADQLSAFADLPASGDHGIAFRRPSPVITKARAGGTRRASWRPVTELREAVEFRTLDLLSQPLARHFDLLTCQNVLTHLGPSPANALLDRLLRCAKPRAVFVCSGLDLDLKARVAAAGFRPWLGRLDEIHDAFATHRMHYRINRGQYYFELEDIDRTRPDWEARYSTLFYRP